MKVVSIALSRHKGTVKQPVREAFLREMHGLEGDAHAGPWHRQVSLLASERIEEAKARGLKVDFGDFAENIATEGIDWKIVPLGARYRIGSHAEIEITQIGKQCHTRCAVYHRSGDCIMPKEGVFAKVLVGGVIEIGDEIKAL